MKKILSIASGLLLLPLAASAAQSAQTFIGNFIIFINGTLIPFLFGIAFLFFIVNAFRFFILGSNNQEGQEKAKALTLYSVAAFVFIIVFWGIINLVSITFDLGGCSMPHSDYYLKSFVGPLQPNCP